MHRASHVVVTLPGASGRTAIIAVRALTPTARLLVRARYLREREDLEQAGATAAVFEEAEAALGLARLVLAATGVHAEAAERRIRDLRLQLIRENMSRIRTQRARSVMVPWPRVRRLSTAASRAEVLQEVAAHRFSRWPVVDPQTGRAVGYFLAKDLIADATTDQPWTHLSRPLRATPPDIDIKATLLLMQDEGITVCVVEGRGSRWA